jgi:predicted transcriptional regulator
VEQFKERRGKLGPMVNIISFALKGARETELVYRTNRNFNRVERYITYLSGKERINREFGLSVRDEEKGAIFLHESQMIGERVLT